MTKKAATASKKKQTAEKVDKKTEISETKPEIEAEVDKTTDAEDSQEPNAAPKADEATITDPEGVKDAPEDAKKPSKAVKVNAQPETVPCALTLEQYFRAELAEIKSGEFRLKAEMTPAGDLKFYIHPFNRDGLTRDFTVMGEVVRNVTRLAL